MRKSTLSFSFRKLSGLPRLVLAISIFLLHPLAHSNDKEAAQSELKALIGQVNAKLKNGQPTAETLSEELATFDTLVSRYADDAETCGNIELMRASLYMRVLDDLETGKKYLEAIQTNYPNTQAAKRAAKQLYDLTPEGIAERKAKEEERAAKLAALKGSPAPEIDFIWSSGDGGPSKLSDLKGQVVVLDFWATWCGPCISSFPQLREHVSHFEGSPVTFLGVTSLQGRVSNLASGKQDARGNPELEYEITQQFMEEHDMTWDVVFSKQSVFNKEYGIRGIPSVTIVAPDGTIRHTALHPGNPGSDISRKIKAILMEFELPTP